MSQSRNRRGEVGRFEKLACWDGDERRPGGKMNSCGRRRCWVRDRGNPGGRKNSCDSYGEYYSSRKGKVEYLKISNIV